MEGMFFSLKSMANSKKFKDLEKCAENNCKKYENIVKKEGELIRKVFDIHTAINNSTDLNKRMAKSLEMMGTTRELIELNKNKNSLLCIIENCSKEYVDVMELRHKGLSKAYEKMEGNMKEGIKAFKKFDKRAEAKKLNKKLELKMKTNVKK